MADENKNCLAQSESINSFFKELQIFQSKSESAISVRNLNQTNDKIDDVYFYKIKKLSYDEDCPQRESFENVLLMLDDIHYNFVYILSGDGSSVELYIGVVNNSTSNYDKACDYGQMIQNAMEGNFSGSNLERVSDEKLVKLFEKEYRCAGSVVGIPSLNETSSDYDFQGTDRLINSMVGQDWRLVVVCEPVSKEEVLKLQESAFDLYNRLVVASKASLQESRSHGIGITFGQSHTDTRQKGWSTHEDRNDAKEVGPGRTRANAKGSGKNASISAANSDNYGGNFNESTSRSITFELANKHAADLMKYIDEELLCRLKSGLTRGMFKTSVYYMADTPAAATKLKEVVTTLFQGEVSSFSPLLANKFTSKEELQDWGNEDLKYCCDFLNHKLPQKVSMDTALLYGRPIDSGGGLGLSSYLTSKEVCLLAGLPRKEVSGIALREGVEFGLNQRQVSDDNIKLGSIMQRGRKLEGNIFSIPRSSLTKHIFVGGVTGSGKTTTCHKLLSEADMPFLVLEPAKTEYRVLLEQNPDLTVFTLGDEQTAPFRLNPFELVQGENISAHVDMVKATFTSAFPMEASMPQILEEAIYRCYEKKGWDVSTNQNNKFNDAYSDENSFPIISDLLEEMKEVVESKHFGAELKSNYIGSLISRLSNLTVGSKGNMLNCRRSTDFSYLVEHPVVIEMEELKSSEDKALFMGFILARLAIIIKRKHETNSKFAHLTLIEEAHRLLAKVEFGDSGAKKSAVETFTDLLAEVRKYGEGLIVVDQIPNKLAIEVLKNTNTKIIHKIFARDDKEAVGDTMLMDDKQKGFLSSLETGQAIIFSENTPKPIHIQIERSTDTNGDTPGNDKVRERFFSQASKLGNCYKNYRLEKHVKGFLSEYLQLMDQLVTQNAKAEACKALIDKVEETATVFSLESAQSVWVTIIEMGELQSGVASANLGREQERRETLLQFFTIRKFWDCDVMAEYHGYLLPYRNGNNK